MIPGPEQQPTMRSSRSRPDDAQEPCWFCNQPCEPGEIVCTVCAEEILQSEVHQ